MQSLDTYRLKLQEVVASIKAWSGFVADVARVETHDEGDGWRLALQPLAPGACPIEMVIDGRELKCDLKIGGETYEDVDLPSLDMVLPLVKAVADGRVVTRLMRSSMTGLAIGGDTLIRLADGTGIVLPPPSQNGSAPADGAVETRNLHFLPYRKPDGTGV
jgi:hypothetical protein